MPTCSLTSSRRQVASRLKRCAVLIATTCLGWWSILFLLQDVMMFPRHLTPCPSAAFFTGGIRYTVQTEDNDVVEAYFVPSRTSAHGVRPVVIFFHGNGELIDHQHAVVARYRGLGMSVLLPEYRGYGRSGGRPSQGGIARDMDRFYQMLINRPDVNPARIVFHGRSLGGGVAADLAFKREPAALILETTGASVARMARRYAAPQFLVKNPYRTDLVISNATYPLLIVHGWLDRIIPVYHGRILRDLAPKSLLTYREFRAGHNDFPGPGNGTKYWQLIRNFLIGHCILEHRNADDESESP